MKGSKALYEMIKQYGVKYVFGMDSPELFYQEIDRSEVTPILIHHEAMGALMADGYARVTFRPGICCGNQGAGVSNLVTGLIESYNSSIPVIALAQAVPTYFEGKNAAQEFDQVSVFKPITKWVADIHDANRIPEIVRRAFRLATGGRPGPVVLNIHEDVLEQETESEIYAEPDFATVPGKRFAPDPEKIKAAAKLLVEAERPCIIAGGGVISSQAWNELIQVAELLGAPVATTIMGKGAIPEDHPLSAGPIGSYIVGKYGRGKIAKKIIQESDVVLLVGTKTHQMSTCKWTAPSPSSRIIHMDVDINEIGRNYKTEIGIIADAKLGLAELYNVLNKMISKQHVKKGSRVDELNKLKEEWRKLNKPGAISDEAPIRLERLMKEISEFIDRDTIVSCDAASASAWAASHLFVLGTGRMLIQPRGQGALGMGLPLALGAKIGAPDKKVFCILGDGGFLCGQVQELETASRYGLNVVVFILNNKCYGWQKVEEEFLWGKSVETDFLDIDFGEVARVFKCWGTRVEKPSEIKDAIKRALDSGKPAVIDVVVGRTKETLFKQYATVDIFEKAVP